MFVVGCKPTLDEPRFSAGEADFTRYVAVGSGLSAGFSDSALTYESQLASVPAMLNSRFVLVGGGSFLQPFVNQGNGLVISSLNTQVRGKQYLSSYINCKSNYDYQIKFLPGNSADLQWIGNRGPYNNLSVPGVKSFQLYSQFLGRGGNVGNYYYYRFASDTGGVSGLSSTVIGDASLINPTFFSLWIGSADIYSYAASGGNGSTSGISLNDITPVDTFTKAIDFVVNSLSGNGAQGVIANIPDIQDIPFFNSIPYNGLNLTSSEAADLNAVSPLGISFTVGSNPYVISEPGSVSIRQVKAGELLLLSIPIDSLLCGGWGTPQKPIKASYVLDSAEISSIKNAISSFNSKLQNVAIAKNLAFANVRSLYKSFSKGLVYNGVSFNAGYIRGGVFSIDGIHPNQRGYALIANEILNAINSHYKSTLPEVDVNSYNGIVFP
jgi:lysophospholipase L1-like esterase